MKKLYKLLIVSLIIIALGVGIFLSYNILIKKERTLKIYNWSYYIDESVIEEFEEKYDVKVVYDTYEESGEAFAKLKIGGGGYDVIYISDSFLQQAIKEGYVQKLDHSKIPNFKNIDEELVNNPYDNGLSYSIPYMWGSVGIGVNTKYVKDEIKGWEQLFNEEFLKKYKGKISMLEDFVDTINAAKFYLKIPLNDWSSESVEKIKELLKKQREYLIGYWGASQYIPGLAKGEVYIAQAWNGDILIAKEDEEAIEYILPEEGTVRFIDFMVIPKGSENVDLAYEWINFLLEPKIAEKNTRAVHYTNSLKRELMPEDLLKESILYPSKEFMEKLQFEPILTENEIKIIEEITIEVKGA
ncbi:MAG: spermidine/putrescine ABC transporter substrate-binding protein [Nitrososphaerota archaeon]